MKKGWKETDRREIIQHIDALRATLVETSSHKIAAPIFDPVQDNCEKLLSGGYEVYRTHPTEKYYMIERYHAEHGWLVHQHCDSEQEAKDTLDLILKDPKNLHG